MNSADTLFIICELALGIAGFSGVVVALGKHPGNWPFADRLRLGTLLSASLGAMFIALVALLLESLGIDTDTVWRICSALISVQGIIILAAAGPGAWRVTHDEGRLTSPYFLGVFVPMATLLAISSLLQAANAIVAHNAIRFGFFLGGLIVLLLVSGIQFARLLFVRRDDD